MSDERQSNPGNEDICPPDWREVPLSSVAALRVSNVDKKSQSGERAARLCNYTDVYNNDYIKADMEFMRATAMLPEIDRFGLAVGDVIITKDSETPDDIGVPTVVDSTLPDLVCGYHLALLRPNPKEVDPTFLAKQLGDPRIAPTSASRPMVQRDTAFQRPQSRERTSGYQTCLCNRRWAGSSVCWMRQSKRRRR